MTLLLVALIMAPAQLAPAAPLPESAPPSPAATANPSPADSALLRFTRRELLPLGIAGGATIEGNALERRLTVRHKRAGAILSALRLYPSEICPDVTAKRGALTFNCASVRVESKLTTRNGIVHLELIETAGPPVTGEAATMRRILYAPEQVDLGGPCPGTTEAGRGECALLRGENGRATTHFHAALQTPERTFAAMRLGDLARDRRDYRAALRFYNAAGRKGPWARLAMVRLCELRGACGEIGRYAPGYNPLDASALPTPLRNEMLLRAARFRIFDDDVAGAVDGLLVGADTHPQTHTCHADLTLCQRIALVAFQRAAERKDQREEKRALALYMTLPADEKSDIAVAAAIAASQIAGRFGAPGYGAALLAGVSARVPESVRRTHLYNAAALYLDAKDTERARMVLAYAATLPGSRADKAAHKKLEARLAPKPNVVVPEAPEVKKARALLKELRARDDAARQGSAVTAKESAPPSP